MKNTIRMLVASAVVMGTVAAWAGDGCCAGGGAAKPNANFTANNDCFAKLSLTAEQRAKVTDLLAECKTSGCNMTARERMTAGLKVILTPDQYTQWTAACDQAKAAKGGQCPFASKAKADPAPSKN